MPDLSRRRLLPERMDEPGLDPRQHAQALRGLARLNFFSSSAGILWPAIRRLAAERQAATLRVLDIASGAGDVAIALARRARRTGVRLEILGVDISPTAVSVARENAKRAGVDAMFRVVDVLSDPLPGGHDILMTSLFLHHLEDEQAASLLRQMRSAEADLVLVSDLRRSRAGLWLAHSIPRMLTRSPIVHVDAPRSVERAFSLAEIRALCELAGVSGYRLQHRWPCRFLLSWRRPKA